MAVIRSHEILQVMHLQDMHDIYIQMQLRPYQFYYIMQINFSHFIDFKVASCSACNLKTKNGGHTDNLVEKLKRENKVIETVKKIGYFQF